MRSQNNNNSLKVVDAAKGRAVKAEFELRRLRRLCAAAAALVLLPRRRHQLLDRRLQQLASDAQHVAHFDAEWARRGVREAGGRRTRTPHTAAHTAQQKAQRHKAAHLGARRRP